MKILCICFGCGINLDAGVDRCENCGVKRDGNEKGWIKAILEDSEGERLENVMSIMLDNAPKRGKPR